jgi:hypothetical protein
MGLLDDALPERYEKNPMFVLLENYVLDAIGHLEPEKAERLNEVLTRNFGGDDWRKTLRQQFDLPQETDENLTLMWRQRQDEADAKGEGVSPEQFAREVVDEMFSDLGGT